MGLPSLCGPSVQHIELLIGLGYVPMRDGREHSRFTFHWPESMVIFQSCQVEGGAASEAVVYSAAQPAFELLEQQHDLVGCVTVTALQGLHGFVFLVGLRQSHHVGGLYVKVFVPCDQH